MASWISVQWMWKKNWTHTLQAFTSVSLPPNLYRSGVPHRQAAVCSGPSSMLSILPVADSSLSRFISCWSFFSHINFYCFFWLRCQHRVVNSWPWRLKQAKCRMQNHAISANAAPRPSKSGLEKVNINVSNAPRFYPQNVFTLSSDRCT